jgi:mannose-6-phosphate isomerase-like protein (cupin superfamily)
MQPGQASPTMDLGRLRRVSRWASTGWSHHGDYPTHAFITRGGMTVEFRPGGTEQDEVGEGDFIYIPIYIPEHLIHREAVAARGGERVVVRVGGVGASVFNVEGPDPAT